MLKNILKKTLVSVLVLLTSLMFFSTTNVFASSPINYQLKRVANKDGILLRDANCKPIYKLPLNSFVISGKYENRSDFITCKIDGKNLKLTLTVPIVSTINGESSANYYGYSYSVLMEDAGLIYAPYQSAKTTKNANLRDSTCKKVSSLPAGSFINEVSTSPTILCSIDGVYFRMFKIKHNNKVYYISSTNL